MVNAGALAAYTTLATWQAASAGSQTSVVIPGTPGGNFSYPGATVTVSSVVFSASTLQNCGGAYSSCTSNAASGWLKDLGVGDHLRAALPSNVNIRSAAGDYGAYFGNNPQTTIVQGTTVSGLSLTVTITPGTGTAFIGFVSNNVNDPVASLIANTGSTSNGPALIDFFYYSSAWPSLLITTTSPLPTGTTGNAYNLTMAGTGGSAHYSWSATGLPAGLNINTAGVISGTPTVAGTFSPQITLTDTLTGQSSPQAFSLKILQSTTTGLTSSASGTATLGTPITLTASVTPGAITGAVTFYNGSVVLGTSTLSGGHATLATKLLPAGVNQLKAFYQGNSTSATSKSSALTQTVASGPQNGFQAPAVYSTGAGTSNAAFAAQGDFNEDGKTDIAVANFGTSNISIFSGTGTGTFGSATVVAAGSGAAAIATGDFNGDGHTDLVVANFGLTSSTVSVLLGNGSGGFAAAVNYATGPPTSPTRPSSVAVGDLNGDGIPDLAVTNYSTGNVAVLLGAGNGTFGGATVYPVGTNPKGVVIGDFDGDGHADLAVANYATSNISVLLNQGTGIFGAAVNYSSGTGANGTNSIVTADFNGDGKLDLAVSSGGSNSLGILAGNGNGTFAAATVVSAVASSTPTLLAIGDFNGDGKLDLITGNFAGPDVSVYLGNGTGGFAAPVSYSVGGTGANGTNGVAVGDFNGDGVSDVFAANYTSGNAGVLLGLPTVFTSQPVTLTWFYPNLSTVYQGPQTATQGPGFEFQGFAGINPAFNVDFGDSTIEIDSAVTRPPASNFDISPGTTFDGLVITNPGTGRIPAFTSVSLPTSNWLDGNGNPFTRSRITFDSNHIYVDFRGMVNLVGDDVILQINQNLSATTTTLSTSPNPTLVGQAVTLSATVAGGGTGTVSFFKNSVDPTTFLGNGTLSGGSTSIQVSTLAAGTTSIIAYYNGDATHDVSTSNTVFQIVKTATTTALTSSANPSLTGQSVTFTATVTPSTATGTVTFLDGATPIGSGTLTNGVTSIQVSNLTAGSHPISGVYGGDPADAGSTTLGVFIQIILNTTTTSFSVSSPGASTIGAPVTFTANVTPANATGLVEFYDGPDFLGASALGNGQAHFTTRSLTVGSRKLRARYTGDSINQFSISAPATQIVGTVPGSGFQPAVLYPAGTSAIAPASGDFNGDGIPDLVIANFNQGGQGTIDVRIGSGTGTFGPATSYNVSTEPYSIAIGDFNRDGNADLAVGSYQAGNVDILLGNGDGTFRAPVTYSAGGDVVSIIVGDFNGDGIADLATANYNGHSISMLRGNGDGTFQPAALTPLTAATLPYSVAAGDFNGDGNTDLVVANSGTASVTILFGNGQGSFNLPQTYSTGAGTSGARAVVVGDFNADGFDDLAVANTGSNNVSIFAGSSNGIFAVSPPSVVSTGALDPETIAVGDFNGGGEVDLAVAAFSTGAVGILSGDGAGNFAFTSTVSTGAGASQSYAMVTGDFNGDGVDDIVATNFTSNNFTVLLGLFASNTTLTSSPNPSVFGQLVTLTASVFPASASGTVTFKDGAATLGSGALGNGVATLTTSALAVTAHSLTATYSGDAVNSTSTSTAIIQTVNQAGQSITFSALSNQVFGTAPFTVAASASSTLAVSFASVTTGVCSVSGTTVTLIAGGVCTIQATQAGNANYQAAAPVNQSFTVTPASQSITFSALSNQVFGTAPFTISATASSGLAVSFASITTPVCTVSGTTVTLVSGGTCVIQATQAGNASYSAATPVNQSFTVTPAAQSITFSALSNQVFGTAPFTVGATASSTLAVSFASTTTGVCTVSGATVTLVAGGACTIQATQAGNASYQAATPVNQSFTVTPASQSITFSALSNQVFGTAPFTVNAAASSTLAVSFASTTTGVCTVSGTTVTLVAGGTCTIQATQAGNASYQAATPVNQSFTVTPAAQSITFNALSNQVFGAAPFTVSATASSGLTVTFASTTTPVCTVSGTTVTLIVGGNCTIQATQAGNASYQAATPISQTFTVTPKAQSITFNALSNQVFGAAPFTVSATASSGLLVNFASTTPAVCSVSGATVTLVGGGNCTVQATQPGDASYQAATPVNQGFTVTPATQSITFNALSNQVFGTSPFNLNATASSNLAVSFASSTTPVCTVSGSTVTLVAAGACTIQATQAGNASYQAATPVSQSFTVTAATQLITFNALPDQVFGTVPFTVSATASSGLTVSFASTTAPVCTVSGTTVTMVAGGVCTIQATQPGNANYSAAGAVSQSFTVTPANQTITFNPLSNRVFGASPFTVSATASSNLPVSFASLTTPVCTVSGTTVTIVAGGTCTIEASQSGNATWSAATPVDQSFTVSQTSQTITFNPLSDQVFGAPPLTVNASASSGLPVSFSSGQLVNVQFGCTAASSCFSFSTSASTLPQAGPAVIGGAGDLWNLVSGTGGLGTAGSNFPLTDRAGNPTPITVTWSSDLLFTVGSNPGAFGSTPLANLFSAYLVNLSTTPLAITIAGLVPNAPYSLYMITQGDGGAPGRSSQFAVNGGAPVTTSPGADINTFINGQNYVLLNVTADSSGVLNIAYASGSGEADVEGFQLFAGGSVCTVSGTTVTLLSAGTCTVQASQPGDTSYAAAVPVNQSFQVTQASQTITFSALSNQVFGAAPFTVSATASSGLPASFASTTTTVCTVSGNTVALVAAGVCTIQATQPGDANYSAAAPVSQTFAVTQANQIITFNSLSNQVFGTPPFAVSATASSGLPVSLASTTSPVCSVSGTTVTGFTVTMTTAGTCIIQATQPGNANFSAAVPVNQAFAVSQRPTSTTLTSSLNPSTFGATVLFTATVAPSTATGTVTFLDGTTQLGNAVSLSGGTAVLNLSNLSVGAHSLTAIYSGDANNITSTSSALTQTINQASTTTTLTSSLNTSPFGTSVTFTANISPSTASGTITFSDGATPLGSPVALSGGTATLNLSTLAVGSHSLTASYIGDTNDVASASSILSQTVIKAATNTILTSSANPSIVGQSITIGAIVSPPTATGTITFFDGSTPLGSPVSLSGGSATFSIASLSTGTHALTASYSGDASYAASTSHLVSTLLYFSAPIQGSIADSTGQGTGFTSRLPGTGTSLAANDPNLTLNTQTGNLTLRSTAADLNGQNGLGVAEFVGVPLAGTDAGGDQDLAVSAIFRNIQHSQNVDQLGVFIGTSSTSEFRSGSLISSNSPVAFTVQTPGVSDQNLQLNSSVAPSQGDDAIMTLSRTSGVWGFSIQNLTSPAKSGAVPVTQPTYLNGVSSFVAGVFAANPGNTTPKTETISAFSVAVGAQTVSQIPTSIVLSSSLNPSTFGAPTTFTVAVSPSSATGNVIFNDGAVAIGTGSLSNGLAAVTISGLSVGSHSVTATYAGDTNDATSTSSPVVQVVGQSPTTLTLTSSSNPSVLGSPITLTASISPVSATGTVSFEDGTTVIGSGTLSKGTVTLNTGSLSATTHSLVALYGGDANDVATQSAVLSQIVNYPLLTITTSSLPTGQAGVSYGPVTLQANGGTRNYTWSGGGFPSGITLGGDGTISGLSVTPFTGTVNISLSDNVSHQTAAASFTFTVTAAPQVTISGTSNLGAVAVGTAVAGSFSASGGTPPYIWSLSGAPGGFAIDSNGNVTGVPGQPGDFSFALLVKDSTPGTPVTGSLTLALSAFGLTTSSLPQASTLTTYNATVGAAGGTAPYSFTITGLPGGLTAAGGTISGKAQVPGTFPVSVKANDSKGLTVSASLSLTVTGPGPLQVTSSSLADGTINQPYSQALSAAGGSPAYSWSQSGGVTPTGLSITPSGTVFGQPTQPGSYTFGVQVNDTSGGQAVGTVTINILPAALQITSGSKLPAGIAGSSYPGQVLSAAGGVAPYTFGLKGSLPDGLALTNGQIAGTPTAPGDFSLSLTVTDSASPAASSEFAVSVTIRPNAADLVLSAGSVSFSLTEGTSATPSPSAVTVSSSAVLQPLDFSVDASSAPWLTVSGGGTTPGSVSIGLSNAALALTATGSPYSGAVIVKCTSGPCSGKSQSVNVGLTVTAPPPQLSLTSSIFSFIASTANPQSSSAALGIQNSGGGKLQVNSVTAGASWITVSSFPSTVLPGPGAAVTITADPGSLAAGYYTSAISVSTSAGSGTIPVTLLISAQATMVLGPAGTQFSMPQGGTLGNASGSFLVSVSSTAGVSYSASVQPGAGWLTGGGSGTATSASPGTVSFSIDPTAAGALAAGAYYGVIRVTGSGILNSPQDFQVVLNISPASTPVVPDPQPGGLLFLSSASGGGLPAQSIQLYASSNVPLAFQASATTSDGGGWLTISPNSGSVLAGSPATVLASVDATGLKPGVYGGSVNFASGPTVRTVNVTLVVETPLSAVSAATSSLKPADTPACAGAKLVPAPTGLVSNFSAPASWPTPITLKLVDTCGSIIGKGQIVATFSNGDPPLALSPVNANTGIYSGTWTPRKSGSQTVITAQATASGYSPASVQVSGQVTPNSAPELAPNGTLDIFNPQVGGGLGPGNIVQIYGKSLATQPISAETLPLPTKVAGTQVLIGGITAPLFYVSPTQVNAQIPFELHAGQQYQVIVSANGALTTPQSIQLNAGAPAVLQFTSGLVIAQHPDGTLVSDSAPAVPGEFLVLYMTGLGETDATVTTGDPSPSNPLANVLDVPVLTLNDRQIQLLFAGLTPGLVGLYQINMQVPADLPSATYNLAVAQKGVISNTTSLPVKAPAQ